MRVPSWVKVTLAGAALVGITAFVARRRAGSGTAPATSDRPRGSSAALELRVRQLEWRVRELEIRRGLPSPALKLPDVPAPPAQEAIGSPAPKSASRGPVDETARAAARAAYFDEVEIALAAEPRDPNWSAGAEERLRESARAGHPGFSVDSARCGTSLCRAEIHLGQAPPGVSPLDPFLATTSPFLPEALVRSGEQSGRAVVYFARQAGAFPTESDPAASAPPR